MKILYYDCFCGISGDMNLGALLDLGLDEVHLRRELEKLGLENEYKLQIRRDQKQGIGGVRVDVVLTAEGGAGHKHNHETSDAPIGETGGSHEHHHHGHQHHHEHRTFRDIEQLIGGSALSPAVKAHSRAIFRKIAEAEGKVHQKDLYEVHFHEVGAIDSIVDIVGAAIAMDYFKADRIVCSTVQLGGGFVHCAHGTIPVPAPATVEILQGIPVKAGLVPFETTTPTGAAILAASVTEFTDQPSLVIDRTGYGIGHRDLEIPNVLRVYLGHKEEGLRRQNNYMLETNIDDMNPEFYGYVEERLFVEGALDVFKTPICMKKGRAAIKLSVLAAEDAVERLADVIFYETTSLGIRKYPVEKLMLDRQFEEISTIYGNVTVKNAYHHGACIKYKPEYEDCRRLATEKQLPLGQIYQEVYKVIEANKDGK